MEPIKIRRCNYCPFALYEEQGIFEHKYCTFGLYIEDGDWREFTYEEVMAGTPDAPYLRRYPLVIPDWCPLKSGPISLLLDNGQQTSIEVNL
jgi:hypothetical protein